MLEDEKLFALTTKFNFIRGKKVSFDQMRISGNNALKFLFSVLQSSTWASLTNTNEIQIPLGCTRVQKCL